MKVNLKIIYYLPFILFILTEDLFLDFFLSKTERYSYGTLFKLIELSFPFLAFISWKYLNKYLKKYLIFLSLIVVILAIESYKNYGTFLIYPHVFFKIFDIFQIFFIYAFYSNFNNKITVGTISNFIFATVILNIIFVNPDIISFQAMKNIERGITASSTFLLSFSFLYYLNSFLIKSNSKKLILLTLSIILIAFFQHRTVWVTSIVGSIISIILLRKKTKEFNIIRKSTILNYSIILILGIFSLSILLFIIKTYEPDLINHLSSRFEDIINPDKENSTSNWRLIQINAYLPFIENNLLFGMRFNGFELPIQFYDPSGNTPIWDEGTGHHFHNHYIDTFFYFGLLGSSFFLIPLIYFIYRAYRNNDWLTRNQITFIAYFSSLIPYGFGYIFPGFVYVLFGLGLSYFYKTSGNE